jgi:hypothetical protein
VRIARLPIVGLALLALGPLALGPLAACSSPSPVPAGWQPIPGTRSGWMTGTGGNVQIYLYAKRSFGGTLQDLASQETINVLLRYRGARFLRSEPFSPCPGAAGVATFKLEGARILERGFSVQNGQALEVTYLRPASTPPDAAATAAMKGALCAPPL